MSPLSPTPSQPFWPTGLTVAGPPPAQLIAGVQRGGPIAMCPCSDCWVYGSHAVAAEVRRAEKEQKRCLKAIAASDKAAAAAVATAKAAVALSAPPPPSKANSKAVYLPFLRNNNLSSASIASDMRPLRNTTPLPSPLPSAPPSIYENHAGHA